MVDFYPSVHYVHPCTTSQSLVYGTFSTVGGWSTFHNTRVHMFPSSRKRDGCAMRKSLRGLILSVFSVTFLMNSFFLSDRRLNYCGLTSSSGRNSKESFGKAPQQPSDSNLHTVLLCARTKDEESYIDEWTDYHLSLGFTDILIYDNSIGNDLRKRRNKVRFGDEKIEVLHWTDQGILSSAKAYSDCCWRAMGLNRTYVAFFDVHEFLILRKHRDVLSLLREYCKVGILSFNLFMFGSGGSNAEPLTRRYTMREPTVDPMVKSVIRLPTEKILDIQHVSKILNDVQHDTSHNTFSGHSNPSGPADVAVLHHYLVEIPWRSCDGSFNLSMSACAAEGTRHFSVYDNSAWLELTSRLPIYTYYDKFYPDQNDGAYRQIFEVPSRSLHNTVSLCTIVKDESIYLDEWTDYNLALGFHDIIIYDNSVENNLRGRRENRRIGDERIEVVHWKGDAQQISAFRDCAERCRGRNRTWAAFFDVDEYLVLRKHENILSLLEQYCQSGAISFNWYIFGTSGLTAYSAEPVTRRFYMRAGHVIDGVKSVVKLTDWKDFTNPHFPVLLAGSQKDTNNKNFTGPGNDKGPTDVAVLHHFWSKSTKEFFWKTCIKGRVDMDRSSPLHKADCARKNLNVSLFGRFDNTAWLELKKRVPLYSAYDKFYINWSKGNNKVMGCNVVIWGNLVVRWDLIRQCDKGTRWNLVLLLSRKTRKHLDRELHGTLC